MLARNQVSAPALEDVHGLLHNAGAGGKMCAQSRQETIGPEERSELCMDKYEKYKNGSSRLIPRLVDEWFGHFISTARDRRGTTYLPPTSLVRLHVCP